VANVSVALWLAKLLGRDEAQGLGDAARPSAWRPAGFADAANLATVPERPVSETSYRPSAGDDPRSPRPARHSDPSTEDGPPSASTGAHGDRSRLREKLLQRGADALADYELLEMLLFVTQPRGDAKPLAKAVISRFGSFAGVLSAPQAELFDTPGLGAHSIAAIKLVRASRCGWPRPR
jgi:DNA repair protein RadC